MAPTAFHLLTIPSESSLLSILKTLPTSSPSHSIFLGRCHHWVHPPHLSLTALTGSGLEMHSWTHLLITPAETLSSLSLPTYLSSLEVSSKWTIVADVSDEWLSSFDSAQARRKSATSPQLPPGWSAVDHSGLDISEPPVDLEFSLGKISIPFGSRKEEPGNAQSLKEFVRAFGQEHTGPVAMFNLLAYLLGQKKQYYEYIAAFGRSIGSRYGGEGMLLAQGPAEWSSRVDEGLEMAVAQKGGSGVWEDAALVWYPSLWHFAKMLDDPEYAEVDRKFKRGVLKDNAVLCCKEIEWKAT